jgi:predicted permease
LLANSSQAASIAADFDWQVLAFTATVSLLTGILFGTFPVWHAMRHDVNPALKDGTHATAGRRSAWLGKALVVLQVSLSTILLIGAGLFVRTLINLTRTPLGFRTDHMLLFKLDPPRLRYSDEKMLALYRQLEEKFAAIPGVRSVTLSNISLIGDGHSGSSFHVSGRPVAKNEDRVQTNAVAADFFQTMGIPLLQGRTFDVHDNQKSVKVAAVNRALARKYFPNENPVGQTFESDADGPVQIVGVVADTRYADLRNATPPTFYVPYQQRNFASRMTVEIRTAAQPFSILPQVRAALKSQDSNLPLVDVRTQEQQIRATLSSEHVFAQLTGGFGLLALALAGIGIYGLMAYTVSRRRGEISIRMALGARAEQVLAAVLRQALWVALAGVSLGIISSLWLARLIGAMLYGVSAADPATIACTALVLICITLVAGFGPAFRASRVDPLRALRHD